MGIAETLIKIIKISGIVIEVLLGLNVLLKLLGALPTFVLFEWIYNLSDPFKSPFSGTFENITFGGRFILDTSAIFAMLAYFLIGLILISVIKFLFKGKA